jgi:tetratricopeptide (TPR) repeat protein
VPTFEGVPLAAATALLDRLAAADEWAFLVTWLESLLTSRMRLDPAFAVRLLRAYRETARFDRAREFAQALPTATSTWNPVDAARLCIERAILATMEMRPDHAEAELRQATRSLQSAPKNAGVREQLDLHVATSQLELKLNRPSQASAALRLAEHVAERIEPGPWRAPVMMTLGHLAMRLNDPRTAVRHYELALASAPGRGNVAMHAHGNIAIALAAVGRVDEGRVQANEAIQLAAELAPGWRHADMYDVLAIVEVAADRPLQVLQAVDEGLAVLGDADQALLRYQLADHRTWALAVLGRAQAAKQWLSKAEQLRASLDLTDPLDEQDVLATRARVLESAEDYEGAIQCAAPCLSRLPDAFVTGNLHLIVGRCHLALADEAQARACVEKAALSGDRHGWMFPDREPSAALWQMALKSGDSRVVRYAERTLGLSTIAAMPPSSTSFAVPSVRSLRAVPLAAASVTAIDTDPSDGALDSPQFDTEQLLYVTTPGGVARVPATELAQATVGATLIVDTLHHALRVEDKLISLERRRALEPLVVQLLRRAKEGLSAEEILRAAGGPGPESADAEHRVRVLISRVRDLLGDPAAIERIRDAGEYGRTRYRLAANVKFALVEPLFSSSQLP